MDKMRERFGQCDEIKSFITDAPSKNHLPLYYLGKSLEFLSDADVAVFVGDWSKTRGCQIEYQAAKAYGVPIVEYSSLI